MAVKQVHVSDLSGIQADEDQLAKLIIHEHPSFATPIVLDVLPSEIGDLPETESYVQVEYVPPGERRGQRVILSLDHFNKLAAAQDMNAVLMQAIADSHQQRGQAAPASSRRGGVRPGAGDGIRRGQTNYASLEHAGEPHRGRITHQEKRIVRDHLDDVNTRLQEKGMRAIDPQDPKMRERYGLG